MCLTCIFPPLSFVLTLKSLGVKGRSQKLYQRAVLPIPVTLLLLELCFYMEVFIKAEKKSK